MLKEITALILIGIVIKLMDDFLDKEKDEISGQFNFAKIIGKGIFPYSLVIIIMAIYLNFNETSTYFAASYLVGMAGDWQTKLPSQLKSWQEGLILFWVTCYMTSIKTSFSALILIILLQFMDDFLDLKKDRVFLRHNLINKLGRINSILISLLLLLIAISCFPLKLLTFFIAVGILYLFFGISQRLIRDDIVC